MNNEFKKFGPPSSEQKQEQTPVREHAEVSQEISEAEFQENLERAGEEVDSSQNEIVANTDKRIENVPTSSGLSQEKAAGIYEQGGFAERVKNIKEKIIALAQSTKEKIKNLISGKPEIVHFSEMSPPPIAESQPSAEVPIAEAEIDEQPKVEPAQPEQAESQETQEQRELREYLEKEVFAKLSLTAEDEQRILAETPEDRREILGRSFENSRKSVETFYHKQVIEGVIDGHAADRAEKQLTYNTLAPTLEASIAEIQPRLAELGIDMSMSSLGFDPETANRGKLSEQLYDLDNQIKLTIQDRVRQEIEQSLLQTGEYKGVTMPTEEQLQDTEFMEQRGRQLQTLEQQAIREVLGQIGFTEWTWQTRVKLDKPYTMGPNGAANEISEIDATQFKVRKTKEEITQLFETERWKAEQTGFLCVNIDASKFKKVLTEGSFRDIFSLSEEELRAMRDIVGRGDQFYLNQRTVIEKALGAYDPEKPTIYGTYASENGDDEKRGSADMYGAIFLKIKSGVQATFCEGDSMSGGNAIAGEKLFKESINTSSDWEEGAKRRQIAPEHAALIKGLSNTDKKIENQLGRGVNPFGYLEAHIKGLKLEDIESINIPRYFAEGISRGTVEQGNYESLIKRLRQDPAWKDKINIIEDE